MKRNVFFFSGNEFISREDILNKIGIRGRRAMELASLKLPLLPGFVIDSEMMTLFVRSRLGLLMISAVVLLELIGFLVIRKIVRIDI